MAKNNENVQETVDVTQQRVKIITPRPRPGEAKERFVSNGRENVLVKLGMEVEVPYWVADRLRQSDMAVEFAYRYEEASEKKAQTF